VSVVLGLAAVGAVVWDVLTGWLRGDSLPRRTAVRNPASDLLQFFGYSHLPPALQEASKPFHDLAVRLLESCPVPNPELTVALRKLLEAKDAAVRARLYKAPPGPPQAPPPAACKEEDLRSVEVVTGLEKSTDSWAGVAYRTVQLYYDPKTGAVCVDPGGPDLPDRRTL
jgi:hypothetical protein